MTKREITRMKINVIYKAQLHYLGFMDKFLRAGTCTWAWWDTYRLYYIINVYNSLCCLIWVWVTWSCIILSSPFLLILFTKYQCRNRLIAHSLEDRDTWMWSKQKYSLWKQSGRSEKKVKKEVENERKAGKEGGKIGKKWGSREHEVRH